MGVAEQCGILAGKARSYSLFRVEGIVITYRVDLGKIVDAPIRSLLINIDEGKYPI